jgi:hypothetical protein
MEDKGEKALRTAKDITQYEKITLQKTTVLEERLRRSNRYRKFRLA